MAKETLTTRVTILETQYIEIVKPMSEDVKEIRTMLFNHVTQPKDDNGKPKNRRKMLLFHKWMLALAVVGFLSTGGLLKCTWDEIDKLVDKSVSRSK